MRKLATIRRISDIQPIPDADRIEVATVDGWKVVIGKGNFKVGDLAVYCEIDSWIPTTIDPTLSKGKEPREYEGVKGERLRTATLRKQLSQGLLLPLNVIGKALLAAHTNEYYVFHEGADVSEILGVIKYEPPVPACLTGSVKGALPSVIPYTDQERIQNLSAALEEWTAKGYNFEVTEKLDGTSMTIYYNNGEFGVCGRNWEYFQSEGNSYWKAVVADGLEEKLRKYGKNVALQGELVGEGIQGNNYKLKGQHFYVFDVYLIDEGRYLYPANRRLLVGPEYLDMKHVPFIYDIIIAGADVPVTVADFLRYADGEPAFPHPLNGMSVLCPTARREGFVYKCNQDPSIHFKAVSNKYLLKEKE